MKCYGVCNDSVSIVSTQRHIFGPFRTEYLVIWREVASSHCVLEFGYTEMLDTLQIYNSWKRWKTLPTQENIYLIAGNFSPFISLIKKSSLT